MKQGISPFQEVATEKDLALHVEQGRAWTLHGRLIRQTGELKGPREADAVTSPFLGRVCQATEQPEGSSQQSRQRSPQQQKSCV